jgi:HTH-type transcriptional regulator / antitoxin HipB
MGSIDPILEDLTQKWRNGIDRSHFPYPQPMEVTDSPLELGTAIRARRRLLGITQDDLGSSIGVSRRVIGQLERGKTTVHVGIVLRAAQAVGLKVGVERRG